MLQGGRDARTAERLAEARRLAAESRVDELRELVTFLRVREGALSPDDEVLLGCQLAIAQYTSDHPGAARGELDLVRALVPKAGTLRQAQFHATAGAVAFRLENSEVAITETVLALSVVEDERTATEELALLAGSCALNLAHTQLFLLAAETAERAIRLAEEAGCPTARFRFQAGYANVCWAMRLQHLGRDEDSQRRWAEAAAFLDAAFADPVGLPLIWQAHGSASRAYCAAQLGQVTEARAWLDAAERVPVQPTTPDIRRLLAHTGGAVLLAEGRGEQARSMLLAYWAEASRRNLPPWTEDAAWLLARVAEADGDPQSALGWYRQVHERYGRAQYEVWLSRATTARLRVEQEALLRRTRQLESDVLSDPLTGVANRRAFDATLPRLVADAHTRGTPLTIAIIDIDRFKRVNDEHGHPVGDEVLRQVAHLLGTHCPPTDQCARYGGDEFVLCLPLPAAAAADIVGAIVRAVADHPWSSIAPGLVVTVTTGLSELSYADTAATLFWTADQSLLAAKRARPPLPGETQLRSARSPLTGG